MSGYLVEGVKSDELIVWDCGDVVVACGCCGWGCYGWLFLSRIGSKWVIPTKISVWGCVVLVLSVRMVVGSLWASYCVF